MNSDESHENKTFLTVIICIAAGIVLGIVLKLFVVDILHVKGTSMQPSLKDGQTVIVNKLSYGIVKPFSDTLITEWSEPKVNDIVIYLYNNKIVVKRCLAVQDTPLEYSVDSGYTLIVGTTKIPLTDLQYHRMQSSMVVPKGMILAIGDNFAQSIDSRTYGFVPVRNIIGKVVCK